MRAIADKRLKIFMFSRFKNAFSPHKMSVAKLIKRENNIQEILHKSRISLSKSPQTTMRRLSRGGKAVFNGGGQRGGNYKITFL